MQEKISIIQSVNDLSPKSGGPSKTVSNLSYALLNAGINLKLISREINKSELPKNIVPKNLIFYKSKIKFFKPFIDENIISLLGELILDQQNLIIHDNGIWLPSNNTICSFARKNKIKLIISPHGMLEPWSLNYKKYKKRLAWFLYQKRNLKNADVLHACSEMEANNLLQLNLKKPIALISNGIEKPSKIELEYPYLLKDLGIKDNSYNNFIFVGRIHPKKGLLVLLESVKFTLKKKNNWRLIIAGYPELNYDAVLKEYIEKNNLNDKVIILGPLEGESLFNLYKNAKFLILPSFSENFGLVVAEALNFGLPVIATTGTPWSILEKTKSGWWVEPTVDDISKAINNAINLNEKEYEMMSSNALILSKKFDWEKISESFLVLYKWMLGKISEPDFLIK